MEQAGIRCIVHDVEAAVGFHVGDPGFSTLMHPAPGFAILERGAPRLLLSAPGSRGPDGTPGGGGHATADRTMPSPGGWNRISLKVGDLRAMVRRLVARGVPLRMDVAVGVGGSQALAPARAFEPQLRTAAPPARHMVAGSGLPPQSSRAANVPTGTEAARALGAMARAWPPTAPWARWNYLRVV
ncbi:VOC family protein [Paeniglutamicibacter psychrophenolicus]|uniref:VOC family protein n=1 Tax=Paeniglutamicibacter psychrophenolicus TaxID=257454 RepID=UPI002781FB92|nr:hypothetical protein [Paeniglutamicibacter psychrophenolicus]MDQ0093579.1 hypothetical protein [Paeniglutamicibacter psychrophenolicus]